MHRVADVDAWQINPGHVRMGYSPERMQALLSDSGFQVLDVQTWVGRWGTLAHSVYSRLETSTPLLALSIPVTDVCALLDALSDDAEGDTVYARALKPVRD